MNGYTCNKAWFDFVFENPRQIKPIHHAIIYWVFEKANENSWAKEFQLPTAEACRMLGISKADTYQKALKELINFGALRIIQESTGRYEARWISLENCKIYLPKKRVSKGVGKGVGGGVSTGVSTGVSSGVSTGVSSGVSTVPNKETIETIETIETLETLEKDDDSCEFVTLEVEEIENPVSEKKEKPSTPSSARPPSPKKSESLHSRLREEIESRNPDYYWTGKDGKALTGIINRIKFRWKKRHGKDPSEDEITSSFTWFLDKLPEWYRDKWDTTVLSSKFDAIMSEIKANVNGKSNKNSGNGYEPGDRLAEAFKLTERANAAGFTKRSAAGVSGDAV